MQRMENASLDAARQNRLETSLRQFLQGMLLEEEIPPFFPKAFVERQVEALFSAIREEEETVRLRYMKVGETCRERGVSLQRIVVFLDFLRDRILLKAAESEDLLPHYRKILNLFAAIRSGTAQGFFFKALADMEKRIALQLDKQIHHRLHVKWLLDFIHHLQQPEEAPLPEMDPDRSLFREWLRISQTSIFFNDSKVKKELLFQHRELHRTGEEVLQHVEEQHYYEALSLLDTLSDRSSRLIHLLDSGVLSHMQYKDETFFHFVELNAREEHEAFLSILNVRKLGLINKYRGLEIGDLVLDQLEMSMKSFLVTLSEEIVFSRGSGGEFYVYYPNIGLADLQLYQHVLKNHLENMAVQVGGDAFTVKICIGTLAVWREISHKIMDKLLHYTLYRAREHRCETYYLDGDEERDAIKLISDGEENVAFVQKALLDENLEIFFQPIFDLETNTVFDVEVLARIKKGNVHLTAGAFIDLIYELDVIVELDVQILDKILEYREKIVTVSENLFINVSPISLISPKYLAALERALAKLKEVGIHPFFELTEQSFIESQAVVRELHDTYGIRFAVDDFGTGYSSLTTVAELAENNVIDYIKIDGSITRNILDSDNIYHILDATSYMTRKLNLKNIAEFIENEEVLAKVKQLGIKYGQGFHFSKPLDIDTLVERFGNR